MQTRQPLLRNRWLAFGLIVSVWILTVCVGVVARVIARGEDPSRILPGVPAAIAYAPFILPLGFLRSLFGFADGPIPRWHDWFILGYWATVLPAHGLFFWLRRWWFICIAGVLLMIGAAGYDGYVRTIRWSLWTRHESIQA